MYSNLQAYGVTRDPFRTCIKPPYVATLVPHMFHHLKPHNIDYMRPKRSCQQCKRCHNKNCQDCRWIESSQH